MNTIIHRSDSRGHFNYGWLNTKHTFSFARYHDPQRVHFGALRVLNDDIVEPGMGFDKHPHDNMEIISIPISGELLHKDSENHQQTIQVNEVQVMSAGTGIFHSEYNASSTQKVNFLQIWIYPGEKNVTPAYNQKYFDPEDAKNQWQFIVSPDREESLKLHQNAYVSRVYLSPGESLEYTLNHDSFGAYLFTIEGSFTLLDKTLNSRDGIGIYNTKTFTIQALEPSYILNIEVPEI